MKRIIKRIELERIDIAADVGNGITTNNNVLKEKIIKALKNCDDFRVSFSTSSYWVMNVN